MKGKIKLLIFIGILVALLPIIRFPSNINTIILFVCGIGIILLALSLRRDIKIIRLKLKRIEGQQGTLIQ